MKGRVDYKGLTTEHEFVRYLEAIYNILQILNNRLNKLEKKMVFEIVKGVNIF